MYYYPPLVCVMAEDIQVEDIEEQLDIGQNNADQKSGTSKRCCLYCLFRGFN